MVAAELLVEDREGAAQQRLRAGVVAHALQHQREAVQRRRGVLVVGAEAPLVDGERTAEVAFRLVELALLEVDRAEQVERRGDVGMVRAEHPDVLLQ